MKILSININSIRAHAEGFLDSLRAINPDTVIVQETKVEDHAFPHILFEHLGYNVKTFGQKSWNGVAVFSKHSMEDVTRGLPGFADPSARMMECVIDGRVRLINVYMPNGESMDSPKFPVKIDWMHHFTKHIAPLLDSEEPVIIGGDFNVAIQDRDIWNPKQYEGSSISAPAAREIMAGWLGGYNSPLGGSRRDSVGGGTNTGWLDCYRHFNPDTESPWTWIGYRGGSIEKDHGLRLDYFLANRAARHLIKGCHIDMTPRTVPKPTDHCGLVLELK
ncbi:MAG: exodeoxyribonuclease III [Alphaproteobacteria bacterium]|nr:exodeoxyribonuclease III [Alphaproteobacteria bacterium]